ncbi:hypothetical protein PHYBLDRAFT_168366 [Phycomyces blakesleeanus NRRL 1555(-)]|uniref:DDE Tnp4 domain-containing protein n=1 Tax=Phycomyces blakesleeanus (strain ATCC 8743b / DSM 1359 / FGSC 10004 / NBRC 33097 / NRRL 1555) TaxID=763407 RepID=A0A167MTQ2_PHYB8|nr:hypothetical protein PHYBLDRAFT_168366 [Phycomyces blakesleeanus NRRL 1555(-)]OAD73944.1 hypothetical protein PHYBLDRAFT_168366 [Phycomyces blakesleeanus NRRL 1555(-)]|eukprot:XP_018291984.1 hypothetical protein PHYBLDRAFT_168366 [Phycomyces blakesleeanus NRRL 1555(-)]
MCLTFDFRVSNGPCYHLYGDPAYSLSDFIMVSFDRLSSDEIDLEIIKKMSTMQVMVKHEFVYVRSLYAFLKYLQTQQSGHFSIGQYYVVGTFLKNIYICFNDSNQTSKKCDIPPPSPEDYNNGLVCE